MKQHVPEDPHSELVSLTALHDTLTGSSAYARARRRATAGFAPFLDAMVQRHSRSPTQFRRDWEKLAADLGVVGHLLAKLRRDGHERAYKELLASLNDPTYLMAGERIAPDRTVPLTLVMLDPPRTLAILAWLLTSTYHEGDLGAALHFAAYERVPTYAPKMVYGWHDGGAVKPLTQSTMRLLTACPELLTVGAKTLADAGTCSWPSVFLARHYSTWRDPLGASWDAEGLELPAPPGGTPLFLDVMQYDSSASYTLNDSGPNWRTAPWHAWPSRALFLVRGTQAEVLSGYPRHLQKRIATWQLRAPATSLEPKSKDSCVLGTSGPRFGFHPEAEHDRWVGGRPAFASHGTTGGFGTVLVSRYLHQPSYRVFSWDLRGEARTTSPLRFIVKPLSE